MKVDLNYIAGLLLILALVWIAAEYERDLEMVGLRFTEPRSEGHMPLSPPQKSNARP